MATLREAASGRILLLEPETVIGRAPTCSLRLHNPRASSVQAVARWTGHAWELRDSSRNGTLINGTRLKAASQVLQVGDAIVFGVGDDEWQVLDVEAPVLMIVAVDGSEQLLGEDGMIGVPAGDSPAWTILRDSDGRFKLESLDGEPTVLDNGAIFHAAGKEWRFSCPEGLPATETTDVGAGSVAPVLHFLVSSDEEYVELRLEY